jgi:hypothetical protein
MPSDSFLMISALVLPRSYKFLNNIKRDLLQTKKLHTLLSSQDDVKYPVHDISTYSCKKSWSTWYRPTAHKHRTNWGDYLQTHQLCEFVP